MRSPAILDTGCIGVPHVDELFFFFLCRTATSKLENATLRSDDLFARLERVADEQDGSPDQELSRSPAGPFESTENTSPPVAAQDLEIASCHELIEYDGGPVCSIEDLSRLLSTPTADDYEAVLPWLSGDPDSETETGNWDGDINSVFRGSLSNGGTSINCNGTTGGSAIAKSHSVRSSRQTRAGGIGQDHTKWYPTLRSTRQIGGSGSGREKSRGRYPTARGFPPTRRLSRDVSYHTSSLVPYS